MAGADMKSIKRRIKSVESTMQITKAMQLVASSKLRKAKERVEIARPYFLTLYETISEMAQNNKDTGSVYTRPRPVKKTCYVIMGGDRGLAGGYNSNIFKFAMSLLDGKEAVIVPLGRKTVEYFRRRNIPILTQQFEQVEEVGLEESFELGRLLADYFRSGEVDEVQLVYTEFISTLNQVPTSRKILPLSFPDTPVLAGEKEGQSLHYTSFEPSINTVLERVVPQYLGGMIYGAVCESFASEQGARRTAMENATDNAEEMIATLSLKYNRARQGAITQELTEIVAGAEALK